jgi:hypothetical protein
VSVRLKGAVGRVWRFVRGHAAGIVAVGATVVVGLIAGRFLFDHQVVRTKLLPPDTPPAEYLYLDSGRVLAYLGQIEGGLTASEKRTVSESESESASLKGGLLADVSGSAQSQTSIESVVTPAATDRFFTMLIKLRAGQEDIAGHKSAWLHNIDARLPSPDGGDRIRKSLHDVHEGDFVRISNAHLFLAPYAAVTPRARYAASYLGGDIQEPRQPLYAPVSERGQKGLKRYLKLLPSDPVLPFVLPTLTVDRQATNPVTFFIPARYSALLDNARLLASNLTVVGKVTYVDNRIAGSTSCPSPANRSAVPCTYSDLQTLTTFAPALQKAPDSLLSNLGVKRKDVLRRVRDSVTFRAPIVVVLPVAIYQ